jgi:hypothetical protein
MALLHYFANVPVVMGLVQATPPKDAGRVAVHGLDPARLTVFKRRRKHIPWCDLNLTFCFSFSSC